MTSCHGLILAGGLSTRMGTDKAQLRRNQQTMLEYTRSLLQSLDLAAFISGGESGLPDRVPQAGPLGGIYTVIQQCQLDAPLFDALLIVPVDMPLLTAELLQNLICVGEESGTAVCYKDCYLPLYLPISDGLIDYLAQVFTEGSNRPRSIKKMLSAVGFVQLPIIDTQMLSNTNTPQEWDAIQSLIEGVCGGDRSRDAE
ncbi:MAG: molybdenum cofactor guanylyltransferase [Porticoccus sp.]|nr:molybdenum cofactor guanylyltransferase [Porticoccus sp.]